MATSKKGKAKASPKAFSNKKAMSHAFTLGLGAGLVQFRRTGPASSGLRASVEATNIQWQSDNQSVPIPMASGIHVVDVAVGGSSGNWGIRVVSPPGATGGINGTLPGDSQASFNVSVP